MVSDTLERSTVYPWWSCHGIALVSLTIAAQEGALSSGVVCAPREAVKSATAGICVFWSRCGSGGRLSCLAYHCVENNPEITHLENRVKKTSHPDCYLQHYGTTGQITCQGPEINSLLRPLTCEWFVSCTGIEYLEVGTTYLRFVRT